MRILVTGASGLLGLNLCLMKSKEHEVFGVANQTLLENVPFTLTNFDLTEENILREMYAKIHPELVINCAAMANVDLCEKNPEIAKRINTILPGQLAELCSESNIPFIHISTDAVFDGIAGNYIESDNPNPLPIYASTKLEGEKQALVHNSDTLIARVNFYGFSVSGTRSLAEFFLYNLAAGNPVKGFTDIQFSPLYVKDLIDILFKMVELKLSGIYHVVSRDFLSKYAFGVMIGEKFNLETSLVSPVSHANGELIAKRSPNLNLNISKLLATEIEVPNVCSGIDHFYKDYEKGLPNRIQSFCVNRT